MSEMIERPPGTIMEVYKTLPEGTLAELINGIIYMSPSPVRQHQRLATHLTSLMNLFVSENNLGEVYAAPFDVYLDETSNAVQPDILFVATKNLGIIHQHIHGVPDLVVEILSDGSKEHDTKKKKMLYEKFGVKEYWIVDPQTKEAIGFELKNGTYIELYKAIGSLQSKLLQNDFQF